MITGAIIPADYGLSAYQGARRLQDLADAAIRSLLDCVEQVVAREREIETGTDGPTVANAVIASASVQSQLAQNSLERAALCGDSSDAR
jgi:hypothetical protein